MTVRRKGPLGSWLVIALCLFAVLTVLSQVTSNTAISNTPPSATQSGADSDPGDLSGSPAVASGAPTADTPAAALLATLEVKGRAPKTGYDRIGDFGTAWLDVDRNGCDTRNDVLQRDLTGEVLAGRCKVLSGSLADPYTGTIIAFVRGETTSSEVQIDHVVPLSDAWQKGAQRLTQSQRVTLANDPLNLMAVDGPTNSQKSDSDAATWLPSVRPFRCEYVARQIAVKATYALWVTPAEHDVMAGVLAGCPGQLAPHSEFAGAH